MAQRPESQKVPGHRADYLLQKVRRFRGMWGRYHRPDDVNHLLRIFPHLSIERGYILDYIRIGGSSEGWIWPYARKEREGPPTRLTSIHLDKLATQRDSGELRRTEVETLYRYLDYERTAEGLFEYAFFISELWATKSASKAAEWLSMDPLFTRWHFDSVLRKAGRRVVRVSRPASYDPEVTFDPEGGGEVRFLVYSGGPWKRITFFSCWVDAQGSVRREPGELVANLG